MMRSTPASTASVISPIVLLLPWTWIRAAGTPAASAIASSPPEAHRIMQPSSWTIRHIALHMNALPAYTVSTSCQW